MSSRFDRRSNNSSRFNSSGGKGKKRKNLSSGSSLKREGSFYGKDSRDSKNIRKGEVFDWRESTKDEGNRRPRVERGRTFAKNSDKRDSDSRSFQRRRTNGRQNMYATRGEFNRPSVQNPEINSANESNSSSNSCPDDILWGRHATQSALEAGRPVHRIWCTSEIRSSQRFLQLLRDAKSSGALVEEVSWARLGHLTNGAVHQGIAIQTAASETLDLQTLIEACKGLDESPLLLALDGLTDPHNLGAIVRSAEALGAHGLVLPQRRSAGLTGSVAKVAAGALEHLPVARVVNLNRSLEELKQVGYQVIGLAEEGDITIPDLDIQGPVVLVAGSEEKGISLVTRRHCDYLVRIPLRGVTPSLNASVATAIFLYELARSGWMKGLSGNAPSPRMERAKCSSVLLDNN